MNVRIDRKYNLENLGYLTPYLYNMEYVLFFGSLLGYCRDKNLLELDDDVDFYVNIKHRNEIHDVLKKAGFNITIEESCFVQGSRTIDGIDTYVDFYLYEDMPDNDYILERWGFYGAPQSPAAHLHVPKRIIYPIAWGEIGNIKFKVPSNIEECCRFLYGSEYDTPFVKGADYSIIIKNNKPTFRIGDKCSTSAH